MALAVNGSSSELADRIANKPLTDLSKGSSVTRIFSCSKIGTKDMDGILVRESSGDTCSMLEFAWKGLSLGS
jgi:hypothetical protein